MSLTQSWGDNVADKTCNRHRFRHCRYGILEVWVCLSLLYFYCPLYNNRSLGTCWFIAGHDRFPALYSPWGSSRGAWSPWGATGRVPGRWERRSPRGRHRRRPCTVYHLHSHLYLRKANFSAKEVDTKLAISSITQDQLCNVQTLLILPFPKSYQQKLK